MCDQYCPTGIQSTDGVRAGVGVLCPQGLLAVLVAVEVG
jgi:hypothetical protein